MTYLAPAIAEILPRARFIHLHRHPADLVRSGMRRGWYANHVGDRHRISPAHDDPFQEPWEGWDAFAKCCWNWQAVNRWALRFCESIVAERCLTLRFEELVCAHPVARRSLWKFLEVDAPAPDAVTAVLKQRANRQASGTFPASSNWSPREWATLQEIAGATMQILGY